MVVTISCGNERRPAVEQSFDDGLSEGEPPCSEGTRSADGECHPSQGEGEGEAPPAGEQPGEGEGEVSDGGVEGGVEGQGQGEGEREEEGDEDPGTPQEGEGEGEEGGPPPECITHADCDDGVFCNGAEGCSEGRCFPGPRLPCVDRVDCTVDICDEVNDECAFAGDDASCAPDQVCDTKAGCIPGGLCAVDENCDDGLLCNGAETCVGDSCQAGEPLACQDDIDCTVESCVEELGLCQSVPDHTNCLPTEFCNQEAGCVPRPPCDHDDDCDDRFFCNGVEFCDPEVARCSAGPAPEVRDETACTIDICSEGQALVLHIPNHARCSDGEFCNGAEVCHPEDGCGEGVPPVLSDGVGCTVDTCDEELDFIVHTPDQEACQDGLFCNGVEVCHPIDDCGLGEPVNTNDEVGCTIDSCSEVDDIVVHTPSDDLCDDEQWCNGVETCDAQDDCQPGEDVDLEDVLPCTEGRCNEADDRVEQIPIHERCDNEQYCDGVEICDVVQGCRDGPDPDLSDGVDCTEDLCDEDADQPVHLPRAVRCDNGLWCDGVETCDAEQGCQDGPDPDLTDDQDCTDDTCDEDNDRPLHTPVHARCLDLIVCDGVEVCDIQQGCIEAEVPADDGLVCSDNPRSLCNDGACALSECGDGLVDEAIGEECDDGRREPGDGCDADCHDEVPEPADWEGDFDGDPFLDASVCGLFDIVIDTWEMSTEDDVLTLSGEPGYFGGLGGGALVMDFTGPVPAGDEFTVEIRYGDLGLCSEIYTVVGSFDDADTWSGTFSARFVGEFCWVVDCIAFDRPVGGVRQ